MEGLEPPRLAALEPKSSASTSSATPASESELLFHFKENPFRRLSLSFCFLKYKLLFRLFSRIFILFLRRTH